MPHSVQEESSDRLPSKFKQLRKIIQKRALSVQLPSLSDTVFETVEDAMEDYIRAHKKLLKAEEGIIKSSEDLRIAIGCRVVAGTKKSLSWDLNFTTICDTVWLELKDKLDVNDK